MKLGAQVTDHVISLRLDNLRDGKLATRRDPSQTIYHWSY